MPFQPVDEFNDSGQTSICVFGPSGAGKTLSSLYIARGLVGPAGRIAVLDTEDKARKFRRLVNFDLQLHLDNYNPDACISAIDDAVKGEYDCLIIDSLSPWWGGPGGVLEIKDEIEARGGKDTKNPFGAWPTVTKIQNRLIGAIRKCPINIICTLQVKTKWESEKDANGKNRNRRVGLEPRQREGVEYEFDMLAEMDSSHNLHIISTRCLELDDYSEWKPGAALGERIADWLKTGEGLSKEDRYERDIRALAETKGVLQRFAGALELASGDIESLEEIYEKVKEV